MPESSYVTSDKANSAQYKINCLFERNIFRLQETNCQALRDLANVISKREHIKMEKTTLIQENTSLRMLLTSETDNMTSENKIKDNLTKIYEVIIKELSRLLLSNSDQRKVIY